MREFKTILRKLRRDAEMSQQELANRIDVAKSSVANWEQGTRIPSYKAIGDIAQVFGVSVDYLYDREASAAHKHGLYEEFLALPEEKREAMLTVLKALKGDS